MMHTKYLVKVTRPKTQTYVLFTLNHTKHRELQIPYKINNSPIFRTKKKTVAKLTDNFLITK